MTDDYSGKILDNGNFSYKEWLVSSSFPDIAARMSLSASEKDIIKLLVSSIEQPLRTRFGPAKIQSGKRSFELNQLVGGAKDSDHLTCNAADTVYLDIDDQMEVFKYIVKNNLPYRQVIYYPEANTPFIHKSINIPGKEYKNEAFVYRDGEYFPWKEV